ncbi:MAG: MOP flippase family protein [Bacteroidales bacterium]|nr:MOP flippase family protein [Bacteroidales bacterium]
MTIKKKAVDGLFWSFIDSIAGQGIQFIVALILARILSPNDFGLIGMLAVFIAISESFINSGFSQALIRKQSCTQKDLSTVFYFNLIVAVIFYGILFISSKSISVFFNEPKLQSLIKVLGLSLILNSISLIHRTLLTKELKFKLQARISVVTSILSGAVAIGFAYNGFGVWSLVILSLCRFGINSLLLWFWSVWRPVLVFSLKSFNELFAFGSKLLLSGLIDTIYRNVYNLVIGKFFSAKQLGFYTRADQFKMITSQNLQSIISRVSFPLLSQIQDDTERLKVTYQKLLKSTMFITFFLMLGMGAVAESMIVTLIGEKWLVSVEYLQLLCFVGMLYPIHALNLNILNVKGRSDLFLKIEIIKKIIEVPVIVIGIFWGIKIMIIAMIINSIIAYFLNSFWSGKLIAYPAKEQLKDIFPSLIMALSVNLFVFVLGNCLDLSPLLLLIVQVATGVIITILICELIRFEEYLYIKKTILDTLKKK